MSPTEKVASAYEMAFEKIAMERIQEAHPHLPLGYHEAIFELEKEANLLSEGVGLVGNAIRRGGTALSGAGRSVASKTPEVGKLLGRAGNYVGQLGRAVIKNPGTSAAISAGTLAAGGALGTGFVAGRASR